MSKQLAKELPCLGKDVCFSPRWSVRRPESSASTQWFLLSEWMTNEGICEGLNDVVGKGSVPVYEAWTLFFGESIRSNTDTCWTQQLRVITFKKKSYTLDDKLEFFSIIKNIFKI